MHTVRNMADGYIICNIRGLTFVYTIHKNSFVTSQPAQPASITVRNRVHLRCGIAVVFPKYVIKEYNPPRHNFIEAFLDCYIEVVP